MRLSATRALLALLFVAALDSSGCLQTVVRPNKGSTVTVSTKLPLDQCAVCMVSGETVTTCQTSVSLVPEAEAKLLFNCSAPFEESYTVTIKSFVECSEDKCKLSVVEISSVNLTEFTRTFILEVKAPEKTLVTLTKLSDGLLETSQPCQDGIQFSVNTSKSKDPTLYCHGGPLNRLELMNEALVSVQVKANTQLNSLLFQTSAGPLKRSMVVTIDSGTTVVLNRDQGEPECEVCIVDGSTSDCSSTEKTLSSADKLSVEFSCLQPQDVFNVKIKKRIECTKTSCKPAAAEADPSLFKDFKRTITWDISVPDRTVLTLDFPANGLREISATEACQDGYQYTVTTSRSDGEVKTNIYCKGGTVSHLNLLRATVLTIEVPKAGELENSAFNAKVTQRGSRMMSVTPDPNTIITIRRATKEPDCSVCLDEGSKQKCNPQGSRLTAAQNTSVEFTCPKPQEVFSVEINREIDCTETACSGNIVQAETKFFPDFNRSFTWDLKVLSTRAFRLNFPEPGMRQIPNQETCPDDHTYTLITYKRTGPATIGTFCKGGAVTTIMARYKGRVSLDVPGDVKIDPVDFKLDVGPETEMMAIVEVNLPRGVSDTDFITPNYPGDSPDEEQMQWNFIMPGMHNYTVQFLEHTAPKCLKKEVEVEYQQEGKKGINVTLTAPQPKHQQGNFNMVLRNCKTNRTLQGLSLSYRVSVMRSGHPVLCTVDLTNQQGVSLQIEKVGSDPFCEISINSEIKEKIKVAPGTKASLSFLDCPNNDLRLTGNKIIGCQNSMLCSSSVLTVPTLCPCLPMPLHNFTWDLIISQDSTLDLVSPTGSLRQSLPGQECNESFSLHVAEADGFSVGEFCPKGMIQKVQVHANVSITATARDFRKIWEPFLNVSISQEIPETLIYTVKPTMTSPTLLATPNWPRGMRSYSTISWIVALPSQYEAHLQFVNVSQPKCAEKHTAINVKMLGYDEELMSRREDEPAEDKLLVPHSFYLNMSNCMPEGGHFGAMTKIVLQKKTNLLAILLALAGVLLIAIIVLAVVCIVTKKKKGKMNTESSIYLGKGNIFRPGDRHFTKTRSENESHVYDYIDDTMVYGHLLGDSNYSDSMQDNMKGMQVDSYQTFAGPTDGTLPVIKEPDLAPEMDQKRTFLDPSETFIPSRPRTPIERQESLGFQDRRMVDNELYTFKSTGEINTIQLSGADLEPQPPVTEDSL